MLRPSLALLGGLGCFFLVRPTLAEEVAESDRAPSDAKVATTAARVSDQPLASVKRFNLLASAGYGASTASVRDLDMKPYGAIVGLDVGYTFPMGLRLGAYGTYGFGNPVSEQIDRGIRGVQDVTIDSSSINAGVSFGYDVALGFFVLRYTLNTGVTFMTFHFDGASPEAMGFAETNSPATGFHFAPGATLLLRWGRFECGVGFDYLVQANGAIPNGFIGKLQIGAGL